jgi:L-seryl-tRNA(Ser) seleniumtransferase
MMVTYKDLGVKAFINASGTVTKVGGSLMAKPVLEAMAEAATQFVDLDDLHQKAGRFLAELIGVEGAFVSAGAASGMQLSAAACMTGERIENIRALPHTDGLKNEFVISRVDPHVYIHQGIEACGGKLVIVGSESEVTIRQILGGVGDQTAAIVHFLGSQTKEQLQEVTAEAKKLGVPVIVDAAAQLPPRSNLTGLLALGASLVVFSGGKGMMGPQCTGLVLGKRAFIEAVRLNSSPYSAIGRGMKVGKEEILGLVTAVDEFLGGNDEEDFKRWERQAARVVEVLGSAQGAKVYLLRGNQPAHPDFAPRAYLDLDPEKTEKAMVLLLKGDPPIMVRKAPKGLLIDPMTLREGEEEAVALRLKEVLPVL